MDANIFQNIKAEYDKRKRRAYDTLLSREQEVYARIPRIGKIDEQIRLSGIKYNKMILLGGGSFEAVVQELLFVIDDLRLEKKRLLLEADYPENYFDQIYQCTSCKDTGYIESGNMTQKCACHRQMMIDHLYHQANLSLSENETFCSFDKSFFSDQADIARYGIHGSPQENILSIKYACESFVENFHAPEGKNLFFSGPTGTGKTFMSSCIASALIHSETTVLYQTAPMLFNTLYEQRQKSFKDSSVSHHIDSNIFTVELLIIDDLGTESPSPSRYADLLTVLNTRRSNNSLKPCKTLISTNISLKDLRTYYDERIASRIIGDFTILRFAGDDIRTLKKRLKNG